MKVFKGGYKIVSLLNIDITSDFTISGIYDDIKDSHGKPILVSEINVGGEKMNDAYTIVKQDNTDYIIEVYGYSLTIASDDSVTVASLPEITSIGTGLTLTDGELSASGGGGGDKWYIHNYQSPQSSISTLQVVTRSSALATNLKEFVKVILNATYFGYYNSGGHEMLGCGSFVNAPHIEPFNPNEFFITAVDKTTNTLVTTTFTTFATSSYNSIKEWE